MDSVSVDLLTPNIDDQHIDNKTEKSYSEDPKYGIVLIDVSSEGEDVPLPFVQVLLEPKEWH